MKKMTSTKIVATLLALVMIIGLLPVMSIAAESNVHVLESKDLEAFAQGAKADGDTTVVGEYFTINWSAKSKVDTTTNKTWSDGYAIGEEDTNRISFGGKSDFAKGGINTIKFTTEGAATVKMWWVCGGDDRQVALYDADGNVLTETAEASAKDGTYLSEMAVTAAGTYYVGQTASNYIIKVEVAEEAAAEETPSAPEAGAESKWVKVTEEPADWSGTYLLVAQNNKLLKADLTAADVAPEEGVITGDYAADALTIAAMEGGYSIRNAAGKYFNKASNAISLEDAPVANTLTHSGTRVDIKVGTATLVFNNDFKYMTGYMIMMSTKVDLYKLEAAAAPEQPEDPETPAEGKWVKVDAFSNGDTLAFVSVEGENKYLMNTAVTGENRPTADAATFTDGVLSADAAVYGVTVEMAADGSSFYLKNAAGNYLSWTSSTKAYFNGTEQNANSLWSLNAGLLYNAVSERTLCVYSAKDWRPYAESNANNYEGETLEIYQWVEGSSEPEVPEVNADFVAAMDGQYNVNLIMNGLYELTITPSAAGAATGTIELVDNNQFQLDGTYNYEIKGEQATVTDSTGAATSIVINYNKETGKMRFSCKQLPNGAELVKVEESGGEEDTGLVMGENHVEIADFAGEFQTTFTAPAAGTYWFYTMDGEGNAYINVNDWAAVLEESGSVSIELAEGQTINVMVATYDYNPDTVDFIISDTEPAGSEPEPTTEELTLVLGENNVNLKPGVNYTLKLDGIGMYTEYTLTFSDKITVSNYGWPMVSGETQVNNPYTIWTVTVEEEVNEVVTLAEYVAPPAPQLNLGENHVEYTGNEVQLTFTATEAGTYVFAPMDGEVNAWVAIEYGMNMDTMSDAVVEIELAEGETINIYVSTNDYNPDTVDFTFTKKGADQPEEPTYDAIKDVLAATEGEFTIEAEIIFIDGKNIYVQDATGGIVVYFSAGAPDCKIGDKILVTGNRAAYNGLQELNASKDDATITAGEPTVQPIVGGEEILINDNRYQLITLTGSFKVTEIYDNNGAWANPNITIELADGKTIQIYKAPAIEGLKVGDTITEINGVLSNYKDNLQLRCDEASDIKFEAAEPEIPENPENPDNGDNTMLFVMVGFVTLVAMGSVVVLRKKEIL